MVDSIENVKALAEAENHLWEITAKNGFAKIEAKEGVIGGEALVGKLDKIFPDKYPVKDLSFIKGKDGNIDPEVDAFVKANPDKAAGFVEYANQYGVIAEKSKGLSEALAAKTIAEVDKLYADGHYAEGRFDVSKITEKATDMNVLDGKGFAHQLKHQFSLDDKQAFRLAEQILDSNAQIANHNKINPKTAIHIPEALFNQLTGGTAQGESGASKNNQRS